MLGCLPSAWNTKNRGWIKGGVGKGGAGNLVVAKIAHFILLA